MKSIAFIDCFGQSPVNKCVNTFTLKSGLPCTYHMPSQYGFDSLRQVEQADAFVILGSITHVTDNLDWHQELLKFIIPKIEAGIPTLGICFGHQLIAHHYGCQVGFLHTDHHKHTEVRDIEFLTDTLEQKSGSKKLLAFSHSQAVLTLTENFEHIATSSTCQYEGLKLKNLPYWSFQAHPEASLNFIENDAKVTDPKQIQRTLDDSYSILQGFIKQL